MSGKGAEGESRCTMRARRGGCHSGFSRMTQEIPVSGRNLANANLLQIRDQRGEMMQKRRSRSTVDDPMVEGEAE